MLAAGARLGTFEIVGPLGAGGMGEVYRARDPRLGREVAIKVLPAERLSDPTRRARFVQEARSASGLNHPHIVTIHEIESADGIDFIVMELVPGRTLDSLIPKSGMRLGEALRLAIPIADALAAAHAKGIVHRDLKPANVMVTPEGVAKVLDFGLAKLTQADEPDGEDAPTLDAEARLSRAGKRVRDAGLHVAGAGLGWSRGRAQRHLLLRRRALRDGHGPAAVRRRLERRAARGAPEGATQAAERARARRAERPGADHPALPAQGARPTLPSHGGRQGRAAGGEGGIRLAGLGAGGHGHSEPPIPASHSWHWRPPAS